jgi:tRNA threonylcarbamoyladenosine biosynthesis protein TsaE
MQKPTGCTGGLFRALMPTSTVLELPDLRATTAFGRRLGGLLFPSALVALIGPLGAGKTHLVRAIAEGLNVDDPRRVSSPTFALIHEYTGRLPIYHFDTYRLPDVQAFAGLGVEEYFAGDGVCLIEWADRVAEVLPMQRLEVRIEVTGETTRRAAVTGVGPRYEAIVTALGEPEASARAE